MKTCFGRLSFCDACAVLSFALGCGARLRCALTPPAQAGASARANAKRRVARAFSRILFRIREQDFRGMAKCTDARASQVVVQPHYAIARPTCHHLSSTFLAGLTPDPAAPSEAASLAA